MCDLAVQRDALERTHGRVRETRNEIGRSRGLVRAMACGLCQNKAILVFIIVSEVLILIGLVYIKFIRS